MNTNTTMLYLLNDALNDNDHIYKYNNMHDNYVHNYGNFYYLKNKIKKYLDKKKNKLYSKLSLCFDDIDYDKKLYIEYINEIYYMNQDILKEINKITFEDNFEYKYNFEIKNNIRNKYKLIYNNIKLRL
jgi:hypothetical protein